MADHGAPGSLDPRGTGRSHEEPEQIVSAIREGQVDAFVISGSGEPQIYTLVKTQEALQRNQDRLELALEAADLGSWEFDFRTREVSRSLRHDQLFGYDELQEEWSRKIARSHFLPEDQAKFDAAFEQAVREGRLYLEGRVRWPDGSIRWLRTLGRTYYDPDGQPLRMVGVISDETERGHAADALRASENRLRRLADAMPQLVWTSRPDGSVDYLNQRADEYRGFVREDDQWHFEAVLHPDDLARTLEQWEDALQSQTVFEIAHRLRLKDGSFRWHLSRAVPYRDGGADVVRWYGTATDIHDRKRAEIDLQAARDRLEVALQAAKMGTWETDFQKGTSHRSLAHDHIFGYDELQPEWGLERARAHVLPEDIEEFDRAVAESEHTGLLRHEVRIRRPDGEVRWIYSLGRYYYDDDGQPIRRAGVIMDITEEKEAEEALLRLNETLEEQVAARTAELEAARDHFSAAFHASPIPTAIMHREDGRLLDVNAEYARFFGYAQEELIGQTMQALDLWGEVQDRSRIVPRVRRGRSLRNEEVTARLRSGELRTVLASVEPIELSRDPCALVMFMDITERKRAEEAVRQLTSALTLAEQRERRRLSQVLHDDLQQILFGVEMRASILRQSVAGGEAAERESDLLRQIDDLRDLVGKAVRGTRVLSIELNPPVLRGEGLAAALVWLARHMEEMHGLQVGLDLDDDLVIGLEDQRVLVVQLVRELLFNVVKHAGVKEASLRVEKDAGTLVLWVEDGGVGFDVREVRETRAHRDSLGLFSVEERLRLFGGGLMIDSHPGGGTRVRIELPLAVGGDGASTASRLQGRADPPLSD